MTRSSSIFRCTSFGSIAANIAAGCGNGSPPGIPASPAAAPGAPGATAPGANPGTGTPNGFHIFCMKSRASCGVNGMPEEGFESDGDWLIGTPGLFAAAK
ncbi:MAG: hypothetical protein IPH55_13820 [Betaproteobacteria bacterium]|nr:hypothetical protein [Betaproteobacteria bacterium]